MGPLQRQVLRVLYMAKISGGRPWLTAEEIALVLIDARGRSWAKYRDLSARNYAASVRGAISSMTSNARPLSRRWVLHGSDRLHGDVWSIGVRGIRALYEDPTLQNIADLTEVHHFARNLFKITPTPKYLWKQMAFGDPRAHVVPFTKYA